GRCLPRSTTGSPRGSTPATRARQRRCSNNSPDSIVAGIDDVAVVLEIEIEEGDVGVGRFVATGLAGIGGDAVAQEMHGTIAEGEVGTSGVQARPRPAGAIGVAGAAGFGTWVRGVDGPGWSADHRGNAQQRITAGPDAANLVHRVAFADHQRVAGAVGYR